MTTQTSRLEIIIDTDRAKKGTDDASKSLSNLEKQGDKTQKQAKDTAKSIDGVGKSSQDASPKIKTVATDVKKTGDEAKTASGKFTDLKNSITSASSDGKFGGFSQKITGGLSGISGGAVLAGAALGGAVVAGVGLAVASLSTMAIEVARNNVELVQFSAIANTTIEKFQGLSGAALTFGITQEKLSDQLKDFNEKIGEFNVTGGGGAADFFEKIAVKTEGGAEGAKKLAEQMSKMDGVDALQTYVDKLEEAGVNQKEMSAYLEMTGSDLTALAPLMANGGKLWKDYQEAMEEAGVITAQDTVDKSIELTSQTESLQLRYQALKSELATQLMPILSSLLSFFMDGSDKGMGFSGVIDTIGVAAKGVGVIIIGLATGIKNLISIMSFAINQIKTIGNTAINFANADGIKAKGSALLNGTKDLLYGNAVKMGKEVIQNSSDGFKGIGNITQSRVGQYDKLTQSIINNRKALLDLNNTPKDGLGGGPQQNTNLSPTVKTPKTPKAKTDTSVKREAERLKREAEREQKEIERLKERITKEYATKEQRFLIQYEEAKADIQKGFANDSTNHDLYLEKAKEAYRKEVTAYKAAQYEKLNTPLAEMQNTGFNATAQSTLSPLEYQKWQAGNEQQAGYSQLGDSFSSAQQAINDSEYISETEKYAQLESLYETYLQSKVALSEQYAQQDQNLTNQYQAASLAGYGAMFGMMGSMLDAYGDKSSSSYKVAFALQKAFVLSSALLNAKGAVMAAWNDPANTTIWSKMAAAAATVVQTNDLMSAIQGVALSGMAHDGIDNVPKEGTWLLDKGERVVDSRTNSDLKSYLAKSSGSGGDVSIQVTVTDSGVSTQSSNSDKKQLGDMIGNAVRAVIRQEQRQGGMLAK